MRFREAGVAGSQSWLSVQTFLKMPTPLADTRNVCL